MKQYEILIRDTTAEARAQAREARRKARKRTANIQRGFLLLGISAMTVVIVVVMSGCAIRAIQAKDVEDKQAEPALEKVMTVVQLPTPVEELKIDNMPGPLLETIPALWATESDALLEREKVVEVLLTHGYLLDAVPMAYEYQDFMRTYCTEYGCPYSLALAVAEVESHFNMDAVGAVGEVGIMQLNPGPGGSYHAELEAATGLDPTTPEGNIAGGCYLLGKFLAWYGDPATAVMAYRMGQIGADKALAAGVDPMNWAADDIEGMERWECTVNAWRDQ